jgi:hypothetical protein
VGSIPILVLAEAGSNYSTEFISMWPNGGPNRDRKQGQVNETVEFAASQKGCWRNIASRTMSALSISIGAHFSLHSMRSAISLSLKMCRSNQGSLAIRVQVWTQSDPCISSIHTAIMITNSNSPARRSGMPYQLLGVLLHTMAMSGLSRVRTELFQLLIIPSLAPHPVQTNCQSTCQGDLGNLPSRRMAR